MPESNAIIGYGIVFRIDDGTGTGTFDLIGEISNIDPPDAQADDVEVTHMGSPNKTREYIAGLTEPGEMGFDINWIPNDSTDVILRDLKTSGARRTMEIVWPNAAEWQFSGFIKGFKVAAPIDGNMTASLTVRVTGSTAFT